MPTTNQPNTETQTPRSHPHPQTCLRKSFITVIWCCLSPSLVVPNLYSGLDRGYFISVRIFLTLLQTTPLAKKTSEFLLDIIWVSTDSIEYRQYKGWNWTFLLSFQMLTSTDLFNTWCWHSSGICQETLSNLILININWYFHPWMAVIKFFVLCWFT